MSQRVGHGEILLAGGGDGDDSWPIDRRLVELIGVDATMGYVPVAMPAGQYPDCEEWIRSVFDRHGLTDIEMWTSLADVDAGTIRDVSAIYVGGGNTYRLLHELRTAGVDRLLSDFVSRGGVLYGGSAGAIICGETIETTPDENRVELTDTSAIGLLRGVDVWCHYEEGEAASQYATSTDRTVVALPERSGVAVTASHFEVVGHEPIAVFDDGAKVEYTPGERFQP